MPVCAIFAPDEVSLIFKHHNFTGSGYRLMFLSVGEHCTRAGGQSLQGFGARLVKLLPRYGSFR